MRRIWFLIRIRDWVLIPLRCYGSREWFSTCCYVSSRSWYFLSLFGLRGLFSLILGDENAIDDTQPMMQMGGFGFDSSKSLSAEKHGLDIIQHDWALPQIRATSRFCTKKTREVVVDTNTI